MHRHRYHMPHNRAHPTPVQADMTHLITDRARPLDDSSVQPGAVAPLSRLSPPARLLASAVSSIHQRTHVTHRDVEGARAHGRTTNAVRPRRSTSFRRRSAISQPLRAVDLPPCERRARPARSAAAVEAAVLRGVLPVTRMVPCAWACARVRRSPSPPSSTSRRTGISRVRVSIISLPLDVEKSL